MATSLRTQLTLTTEASSNLACVNEMIQYLSTFQGRPEAEKEIDDLTREKRQIDGRPHFSRPQS